MLSLPTGISDFEKIIKNRLVYADKTELLYHICKTDAPYFLSRPRRFGKTLLVSTIEAILKGRQELFKGLWIGGSDYDWTPRPVIHLSFGSLVATSVDAVNSSLMHDLRRIGKSEKLNLEGASPPDLLKSLIVDLYEKNNNCPVAVLIDEYDTPILSALHDTKLADQIRQTFHPFYNALKDREKERGFTFITGITKFAQISIFSAFNNPNDITLDPEYSTICGFTVDEFDQLFSEHMETMLVYLKYNNTLPSDSTISDLRKIILELYDGYSWDGQTHILNPWSILNALRLKSISAYWVQSGGVSTYISNQIKNKSITYDMIKEGGEITLDSNIMHIGSDLEPLVLMFQAGYLTVDSVNREDVEYLYHLSFPNFEVKANLITMMRSMKPFRQYNKVKKQCENIVKSLDNIDANRFQVNFGGFLANCTVTPSAKVDERLCHSLFSAALDMADADYTSEFSVADGRYDCKYITKNGAVLIIEIKYCPRKVKKNEDPLGEKLTNDMSEMATKAMEQIDNTNYTKSYWGSGKLLYKVPLVIGGHSEVLIVFKKEDDKKMTPR